MRSNVRRAVRSVCLVVGVSAAGACVRASTTRGEAEDPAPYAQLTIDPEVVYARAPIADLLRVVNSRDVVELEARYGLRADTPERSALLRMIDRARGPGNLRARLMEDPSIDHIGPTYVLVFPLELTWTTGGGVPRSQRLAIRCATVRDGNNFVIASVTPGEAIGW